MDANSNKNQCLFTGHVNIVKLLLENDADRNLLNEDGQTALALAKKKAICGTSTKSMNRLWIF